MNQFPRMDIKNSIQKYHILLKILELYNVMLSSYFYAKFQNSIDDTTLIIYLHVLQNTR